jgi:hypothetical protein
MSGSAENMASSAYEDPSRREVVLDLTTASRMLPLVQRIVADILHSRQLLARLLPEQDILDRQRRTLDWPGRQRRYQLQEDVSATEQKMQDALAELEVLGLILEDGDSGQIGFPTLVNDSRAYFSWKPGEEGLLFWHFASEAQRRPIPASWFKASNVRLVGKS